MTGHNSVDKKDKSPYNIILDECFAGRGSNEIVSAVTVMLESIIESLPQTSVITMWSDSCICQNRISVMTFALKCFLERHKSISFIEQKICTPGHSYIQEVDTIHSHIEIALKCPKCIVLLV